MKIIISGATGFIGRKLINELRGRGNSVTPFDSRYDEIDIFNRDNYDCFIDLAWSGTSGSARADYVKQLANVKMTCNYVKMCSKIGCNRFIYASSINEIETYEYLQSDNPEPGGGYIYGTAKLAAHLMAETVAKQLGIDFIPVIITNIFGPGENSERLINSSIRKLLRGEHCSFTKGYQMYDFIYISDALETIIAVAQKGKPFVRYYIGSGKPEPLRNFLMKMRDIVAPGTEIGLGDIPFNGADISYDQFDMMRVKSDTGFENKVSFAEGIKKTADWITQNQK